MSMSDNEIFELLFNGGMYSLPYLIKLSHPDLETIYLVNNNEDIIYNGNTYKASDLSYTPPDSDGANGELQITSAPSDNTVFEFVENADYNYRLDVVGAIQKDGTVQGIKVYKHFYGSISVNEKNEVSFSLGNDDRKDMIFTPYTYDTDNNKGNA